jgi:hypothetical protein
MSTRSNLVTNKVVVSLLGETDEKADQEARRTTLPGVSWNWLFPCEAAGETGAADICGSLCEMRRQGPSDELSSERLDGYGGTNAAACLNPGSVALELTMPRKG